MNIWGLLTEKNAVQIAVLAAFFFFGDWIYNLIINNIKKRVHNHIIGFAISLAIILLIASVPILLVDLIIEKAPVMYGWTLSVVILIVCLIKFYMS